MSGLDHRRNEFLDRWPVAKALDIALRDVQNKTPLFYFAEAEDDDLAKCTWVLGRLGVDLEKRFGLVSEVLILFTPYADLQRRTFNALTDRLRREVARQQATALGQVRFTPDSSVSLLYAPDPRLIEKIESWNADGTGSLVAGIPMESREPAAVRLALTNSLNSVLSERDLYQGRNPVTGNDFFGRESMLRALRAALKDGHSIGLFGLRRSGKTSVIQEFKRRNIGQGFAVVVSDLEALASLDEICVQLSADLTATLRELREVDPQVWIGSPGEQSAVTFADLSSRIRKVAEKNRDYTFVFAFDEIESLVPLVRSDAAKVRTFLGAIRRAAQGSTNVCLLLTGVTNRFFRDSMLDLELGIENPMLGFVDEFFLGPLDDHEARNLLGKLGRGMMLTWDDDALEAVTRTTGGYPFLVRDLASVARSVARESGQADKTVITHEVVQLAVEKWRDHAAELWGQITQTLQVHHELMAEMIASDTNEALASWLRLGDEAERAARALEGLGLLSRDGDAWRISSNLESLQRLRRKPTAEFATLKQASSDAQQIKALAAMPEGPTLEFKATARANLRTGAADDKIKKAVVKSVAAFLNSFGGDLLVGVSDEGTIDGIGPDLNITESNLDKYERYLWDTLRKAFGDATVSTLVQIRLCEVSPGVTVCRIQVAPATDAVWVDEDGQDQFYARNGNQTVALRGREVASYLESRRPSGE